MDFDVLTLATPATSGLCSSTDYFHVSNIRSVSIKTWLTSINTILIWQGTNAAIDTDRQVEIDQDYDHGTSVLFISTFIKTQFPPNLFHRLKLGPLSPTRSAGKTLGRICTWRWKVSLKRHLNIIEILWVRQVLAGGKLQNKYH